MNNVLVTVETSLSHIGSVDSIQATFHREEFIDSYGQVVFVPTVTGNGIRGLLRDCAMLYMFEKLNLRVPLDSFYMLFSGGTLTQKDSKLTKLLEAFARAHGIYDKNTSVYAQRFDSIPALTLFGSAVGNTIMHGRLRVGKMLPLVTEIAHLVPEVFRSYVGLSAFDIMQTEYYVRKDDAKDVKLRDFIVHDHAAKAEKDDAVQQMRYAVETIKPGTRLWWWFDFIRPTQLEKLAFYSALLYWSRTRVIGGKGSVGHGVVSMEFADGHAITSERVHLPALDAYDAYLVKHADLIREVLHA